MFAEEKQAPARTAGVTLAGEAAVIMGERNPFATVATLRLDGPVYRYAWPTVRRLVDQGGAFTSDEKIPAGPYRTVTRATAHRINGF